MLHSGRVDFGEMEVVVFGRRAAEADVDPLLAPDEHAARGGQGDRDGDVVVE